MAIGTHAIPVSGGTGPVKNIFWNDGLVGVEMEPALASVALRAGIPGDAQGLEPLDEWQILQQVTLPEKLYIVIEHRARKYRDQRTGRIHIAPMPEEVRTGGLLGADMTAAIAFMKGGCHMSYSTIGQFFKEVVRLDLSRGVLCKATQKVSQALSAPYQQLLEHLQKS